MGKRRKDKTANFPFIDKIPGKTQVLYNWGYRMPKMGRSYEDLPKTRYDRRGSNERRRAATGPPEACKRQAPPTPGGGAADRLQMSAMKSRGVVV